MICTLVFNRSLNFSANPHSKQVQISHIKIIKQFRFESVYYQSLNIISTFLKLVTIHDSIYQRGNILVWIVVNSAIPLVEVFYNKEHAEALVSILFEYEKKYFKTKNFSPSFCVERSVDRLTGITKRSEKN